MVDASADLIRWLMTQGFAVVRRHVTQRRYWLFGRKLQVAGQPRNSCGNRVQNRSTMCTCRDTIRTSEATWTLRGGS